MEIKERFGKAVREQRTAKGISQEELAMRIGADQAYVSRIEAGQMNVTDRKSTRLNSSHSQQTGMRTSA